MKEREELENVVHIVRWGERHWKVNGYNQLLYPISE
jgi:hypothetical protein